MQQKEGVSKSSWISTTCAPWVASSRIRASAAATLASRSQLQAIWVAATVTSRIETPFLPVSDHAEIFGGEIDGLAQAVDQLVDFLPADDQRRQIGRASCRERVCQYV